MNDLDPKTLGNLPIPDEYHMKTQMMFFEWRHQSQSDLPPIFTWKRQDWELDGVTYKSMYLMYMQCSSEYEAAMVILGSWAHWQKLLKCKWFAEVVEDWREEMKLRDEAIAKDAIRYKAEGGDIPAAKALLAEARGEKPSRGRPKRGGKKVEGNREKTTDILEQMLGHTGDEFDE